MTAEWRAKHSNTEPATNLLDRILLDRRQKWEAEQLAKSTAAGKGTPKNWQARYQEPLGPTVRELPLPPDNWSWVTLGQLLYGIEGGKSFKCLTRMATKDEWGVIKVSAMTWGTFLEDEQKAIPPGIVIDPANEIKQNDILLSRSNTTELVGATVLVGNCRRRLLLSDKSLRLLASDHLNRQWLHRALSSRVVRRQLSAMATGTSDSMRNVSQDKIQSVAVPLPPLREQDRIAEEVARLFSLIDQAEAQVVSAKRRSIRLRQGILKQAFAGNLLAQDPADEPASALLARIQRPEPVEADGVSPKPPRPKTLPRSIFVLRAAVVSYAVRRLATQPSFGRTQLEKTLHLTQCHLDVELGFCFQRYAAGPFDKDIYKFEHVAKKNTWFSTKDRPKYGVTYHPGTKIDEMCRYVPRHLGPKQADLDRLLDHIAGMNTDEAELFATAYAAWNDLLIDGRQAEDDEIIAEIHGWHESKKRFTQRTILARLKWMRTHGYVPRGTGERTQAIAKTSKLKRRRRITKT